MESIPIDVHADAGAPRLSVGHVHHNETIGGDVRPPSTNTSSGLSGDGPAEKLNYVAAVHSVDDGKATGRGTFADADIHAAHWRPLDSYEGAHRFDPDFEWTEAEEKRLVRMIDWRICSFACLTFFALQLDRGNITQAVADNMLDDLGMITNQYNNGQTIFYLSFLAAELPSQLISKWIGPDNWVPIQMISWSLVASMQAFLSGPTSFYITRALLGMIEGGFIPDMVLYLSYWYKSGELPRRLSFFWVAYQSTSIISAFLAFGILHLGGVNGFEGWRWLFALEGCGTGLIGIFAFFYMAPSPTQTASFFRGRDGWFTPHEEKILVNRILRDDPSKGDMHNRQPLTFAMLWACLRDYDMWPIYLVGITWMVPTTPLAQYLTLQLKAVDFTTFQTNLLTIPAYVIFILGLLFWTWVSERLDSRLLVCLASPIWNFPLLVALEVLPANRSRWVAWALSSLVVGSPYVHAILVALTSRNAGSVRTRTVATALYNMTVQMGNVVGTQIYRTNDAPLYRTGNKALIFLTVWSAACFVFAKVYYVTRNRRRERVWSAMSPAERRTYLATTTDKGNKRLDFRFAH